MSVKTQAAPTTIMVGGIQFTVEQIAAMQSQNAVLEAAQAQTDRDKKSGIVIDDKNGYITLNHDDMATQYHRGLSQSIDGWRIVADLLPRLLEEYDNDTQRARLAAENAVYKTENAAKKARK